MIQEQSSAQPNEEFKQLELEEFRREIEKMAQQEARENTSGHFQDSQSKERIEFDASELSQADMEIWREVERGEITREQFKAYEQKFL